MLWACGDWQGQLGFDRYCRSPQKVWGGYVFASSILGSCFSVVLVRFAFIAIVLAGCSPQSAPELLSQLEHVDLSEKKARPVGQEPRSTTPGQYEIYPGDDSPALQPSRHTPTPSVTPRAGTLSQGKSPIVRAQFKRGGSERASEGFDLNFENANLTEVVKVILGDILKVPYSYDPRVQGQITLSSGRAVSREELLSILESALRMNGAVLVPGDSGGYRITPAGEAVGGDLGTISMGREGASVPGYGISVLPLNYVSADAMLRLLENFLTRGGSAKADASGNLLLIRGSSRERQLLMDAATSFDLDWLRGQSAGIFPLVHTTPDEIIAELTPAMRAEEGEPVAKMISFQPINRLNAVMVVTRQSNYLELSAKWIRRLDRSSATGHGVYVYRVEHGKAVELAALLNETLSTGSTSRRTPKTEVAPGRDVLALATKGTTTQPTRTDAQPQSTQRLAQVKSALSRFERGGRRSESPTGATGIDGGSSSQATPEIRIVPDEINNVLLIRANPGDYDRIKGVLRQLDQAPLQVMINATIAEVTLNDNLRYGVQVFLKGKKLSAISSNTAEIPITTNLPGLNLVIGSIADPRVVLDALAGVTQVKVVSSPSVVVVDNQPAVLKVGDEVPVTTQQAISSENPLAPIVSSIRFRDTGVILKVIPRIHPNNLVTMDIDQEISAVVREGEGTTLTPRISQRHISSTISVQSGQMVALGGLISEESNREKSGLPGADRIPILGELIGTNTRGKKRTELIVFIRPQVIRDSRDASAVAEEMRSRLRSLAPARPPVAGWQPRSIKDTPAAIR